MSPSVSHAGGIRDLQTRFLLPFFFQERKVEEACAALQALHIQGKDGAAAQVWECAGPPDLYREELLDHVGDFLLEGPRAGVCAYLRLTERTANSWFNGATAVYPDGRTARLSLARPGTLELFLSTYGVGVLSVGLCLDQDSISFDDAKAFNYRLSQLRHGTSPTLRVPHPSEDKARWARLTEEQRKAIAPAPPPDAPIREQLGRRGGAFTLSGLIEEILRPLATFELRKAQGQLSVYSVIRFTAEVDFEDQAVCRSLSPFLSAIAQIEEPSHAATPTGTVVLANEVFNRQHWAAVGLMGVAHLIADQSPPELPFNAARAHRMMTKYFIPYLASVYQRTALHRTLGVASRIVLEPDKHSPRDFNRVRKYLLEFALDGYFSEVSHREVIQRYYRMLQKGLDVRRAFDEAHRAISEIDKKNTAETQLALSEGMKAGVEATHNAAEQMRVQVGIVASIQRKVELIEIFIVFVYAAELTRTILEVWPHEYEVFIVAGVGVLIAVAAFLYIKPFGHHEGSSERGTANHRV